MDTRAKIAPPRVMVLSMPKAGTYLMAEVLRLVGLEPSHLHLNDSSYDDYSKLTLDEGRAHPELARIAMGPLDALKKIQPGQFAVGHLGYSQVLELALQEFRIIFLCRDPRTALVSFVRFLVDSGRAESRDVSWRSIEDQKLRLQRFLEMDGDVHLHRYRELLPWASHPAVFHLKFEDLVGDGNPSQIQRIEELFRWLGLTPELGTRELLDQAKSMETVTKASGCSQLDGWWSDAAHFWWLSRGGELLAREYGYSDN